MKNRTIGRGVVAISLGAFFVYRLVVFSVSLGSCSFRVRSVNFFLRGWVNSVSSLPLVIGTKTNIMQPLR